MLFNGKNPLAVMGPGILVAATGVGAGDLATSAFTGSALGLTILWAVVLGTFFKFMLNEGLARWQLATGRTLLEGCFGIGENSGKGAGAGRFSKPLRWFFLGYLVVWSFLVAAALMSAIGVTCHAILPLFGSDAVHANKITYGIVHSALAVALVRIGGYRLFEKVMSLCVGLMFGVVVFTVFAMGPSWKEVTVGLLVPSIPDGGVMWTIALIGGVGGTVTVLSYGYWIREEGREGSESLRACRIDLASGYAVTAVFGLGMVIIGNSLGAIEGGGASLIVNIARQLEMEVGAAGPAVKWAFLVGAWGAIFSSLLGVWQSVPYMFADVCSLRNGQSGSNRRVDTGSLRYRGYLYAMGSVPIIGLAAIDFQTMQQTYAIVGALFVPMLAAVLLLLNSRSAWVGHEFKNSFGTSVVLATIVLFFVFAGMLEFRRKLLLVDKLLTGSQLTAQEEQPPPKLSRVR